MSSLQHSVTPLSLVVSRWITSSESLQPQTKGNLVLMLPSAAGRANNQDLCSWNSYYFKFYYCLRPLFLRFLNPCKQMSRDLLPACSCYVSEKRNWDPGQLVKTQHDKRNSTYKCWLRPGGQRMKKVNPCHPVTTFKNRSADTTQD